ncbi:MAG TPA: acyloxyacyl hydrolase [Bacteroidia bacterium]|nr:acyloxyacyl hydrolase [Bacteroidia bacterium]
MRSLLLLFFSLSVIVVDAQRDTIPPGDGQIHIGGSVDYGFLWAHRYSMGNLVKAHILAGEIDVFKPTNGNQPWQGQYFFPQIGIAVVGIPLGNPDQLGSAFGIYPYINFPLRNRAKTFKWYFRYGWGLGYLTKKFDPLENHQNVAIGSHFNTCFSFRFNGMWNMNDLNTMEFGIGMTHFSNGCVTMPNLGLNIPMISVGYFHRLPATGAKNGGKLHDDQTIDVHASRVRNILEDRSWHILPYIVFGMNDTDPPGGNKFGVANLLVNVTKQASAKTRWLAGFDIMSSQAIRQRLADEGQYVSQAQATQYGVKAGYEMVIGRIALPFEMGVYVHTLYKENGPVYTRFGVHYMTASNFMLCFNLKTHFAKAEYWEAGLAYRF